VWSGGADGTCEADRPLRRDDRGELRDHSQDTALAGTGSQT
jgi:hypothetical protein